MLPIVTYKRPFFIVLVLDYIVLSDVFNISSPSIDEKDVSKFYFDINYPAMLIYMISSTISQIYSTPIITFIVVGRYRSKAKRFVSIVNIHVLRMIFEAKSITIQV